MNDYPSEIEHIDVQNHWRFYVDDDIDRDRLNSVDQEKGCRQDKKTHSHRIPRLGVLALHEMNDQRNEHVQAKQKLQCNDAMDNTIIYIDELMDLVHGDTRVERIISPSCLVAQYYHVEKKSEDDPRPV